MDAVVAKTSRRIPSDSVDPTVKNFHGGDLTRACTRPTVAAPIKRFFSITRATAPRVRTTTCSP
jgi:hypothetical protein